MSVPSTDLKNKYEGNGVQTAWPFTFKVFTKEEILVKKITSGGESILVLDVDYTVSGAGDDSGGGFVNYPIVGTPLAVNEFIVLKPNLNYSQNLVLLNQNTFPPKAVEYGMDRLAMQIKQVAEELSRALQLTDAYDGNAEDFVDLITAGSAGLIASLSGTSLSTVTIGTGSKTFTTQAGKSWALGQRLRAASDDGLKIIEGPVTAYSGTSLTIGSDFTLGSGSHADWNISLAGQRGANGAGSGDILAANNGSDFANLLTTFNNLKQQATTSLTGVARLATQAEVNAGLSTNTIVTPETLAVLLATFSTAGVPVGTIVDYAGTTEPSGWVFCYGQAVLRVGTYANLFSAIGTTYGAGDGSTTFNLPDFRGRVSAGQDDMGGTSANRLTGLSGGLNGDTLGAVGGAESHTLTTTEMPSHSHNVVSNSGGANNQTTLGRTTTGPSAGPENLNTTTNAGGGGAHNNVQPTIILNKIIKV